MFKSQGQSLQEYGIVLALLAIVSVGALQFLGVNTSHLLGAATNAQTMNQADQLYSVIHARANGGSSGNYGIVQVTGSTASPNGNGGQVNLANLQIDQKTGQVLVQNGSGIGTNTTSVDGQKLISALSSQIDSLTGFKTPSGAGLPPSIQTLLKQLAAHGKDLSADYGAYQSQKAQIDAVNKAIAAQNAAGKYSGPPYYPTATVTQTMHSMNDYIELSQTYQSLNSEMNKLAAQDPQFSPLIAQINQLTGGITNTAFYGIGQPILSELRVGNVSTMDLLTASMSNPAAMQYFQSAVNLNVNLNTAAGQAAVRNNLLDVGTTLMVGTPLATATVATNGASPSANLSAPPAGTTLSLNTNLLGPGS